MNRIVTIAATAIIVAALTTGVDAQQHGRLVPPGTYLMMPAHASCPAGFTDNATLNSGRFPRGGRAPATGGTNSHWHSLPDHQHYFAESWDSETEPGEESIYGGALGVKYKEAAYNEQGSYHAHRFDSRAYTGRRVFATDSGFAQNLPPYATVRFCQAQ